MGDKPLGGPCSQNGRMIIESQAQGGDTGDFVVVIPPEGKQYFVPCTLKLRES